MSSVKVNGNTYKGVTSVKLPLADGTGYATYGEGAVTSDITDILLTDAELGDMTNSKISALCLNALQYRKCGNLSFPVAAEVFGSAVGIVASDILLPKVTLWGYRNNGFTTFRNCDVSGTIDLSGITQTKSQNQSFYGSKIGTLLLGAIPNHNGMFQTATITNLVWDNPGITADKMGGAQGLGCANANITNAYVPDALYDDIKALIDNGALTTVASLYRVSEWSGE